MRRSIGLLVCVAAVAALVGPVAASGAGPNWIECLKVRGGALDKRCNTEGGSGGYEAVVGIGKGKGFKGKGGKAVLHDVVPGKGDIKVECTSFKDYGSPVAPDRVKSVILQLSKCKSLAGASCKTEGGKAETITSNPLTGYLGYIDEAHTKVGLALTSEAEPNIGYTDTFECEGLSKVRVHGASIGVVNTEGGGFSKEFTLAYSVAEYLGEPSSGYRPLTNPPSFEEGAEPVGVLLTELNGPETGGEWGPEGGLPSGIEGTGVNKGETLKIG